MFRSIFWAILASTAIASQALAGSGALLGGSSASSGFINDDQILWGSGPDQVSLDDVPNGVAVKLGQDASSSGSPTFSGLTLSTTPLALTSGGTGATSAAGARVSLGLGTIATQNASSVAITGGSISGITDLSVADGGTNASTPAGARANLEAAASGSNDDILALTGLAGVLQAPSAVADSFGNEVLRFQGQVGAVNEIRISNALTGASPMLEAAGDDANVNLTLMPKANGRLIISNDGSRTTGVLVGHAGSGNRASWIALIGDDTNAALEDGLRIARNAGGEDAEGSITNAGAGNLTIKTKGAGGLYLGTDDTNRLEITSAGDVIIPSVQITGGTIAGISPLGIAAGGTATGTAPSSGQLLIGNGVGNYSLNTLSAGQNIAITNGSGSITIAHKLSRTPVNDADYSALVSDGLIAYTAISAARVVTLPTAASAGSGFTLIIKDESGSASVANTITIDGNGAETIDGAPSTVLDAAYESVRLYNNGSQWFTF